ncbi:MAG: hypothetical protein IKP95_12325, partial [Ruminococcus sp.]|nr:hypothetical protein [Ruminococcus sp.]
MKKSNAKQCSAFWAAGSYLQRKRPPREALSVPVFCVLFKATPHNPRLTPLHAICLPAFRHITQILLAGRQPACVEFRQSDENLDFASD